MRRRAATSGTLGLVWIVSLALSGCGTEGSAETISSDAVTVATTTTVAPSPTTTAARQEAATTTEGPTTTTSTLPQPVPPPPEGATEPLTLIGGIEIPTLGVTKWLYEGITIPTLDQGPGHWPGSAMPGQPGNVVIAGHRTSKDHPFRDIDRLVAGDPIIVTTSEGSYTYRVVGTMVVDPEALWITTQTPEPHLTLFACHPPGSTRQRLIVYAELAA
jgi:sortase A